MSKTVKLSDNRSVTIVSSSSRPEVVGEQVYFGCFINAIGCLSVPVHDFIGQCCILPGATVSVGTFGDGHKENCKGQNRCQDQNKNLLFHLEDLLR